jgi:DNA-binding NtrC family response regulator
MIERAVAMTETDVIELDDLPAHVRADYATVLLPSLKQPETLRVWAGRYVRLILDRSAGNKREACRVLGISYHTLQAYIRLSESQIQHEEPEAVGPTTCAPGVSG